MLDKIERMLKQIKPRLESVGSRLARMVAEVEEGGEAHAAAFTSDQKLSVRFGAALSLDLSADLERLKKLAREIELRLQSLTAGGGSHAEIAQLAADTAILDVKLTAVGDTLNRVRLAVDGVTDIWGKDLPTGGLWDK